MDKFKSDYEFLLNAAFGMTGNPYLAQELIRERDRLNELTKEKGKV